MVTAAGDEGVCGGAVGVDHGLKRAVPAILSYEIGAPGQQPIDYHCPALGKEQQPEYSRGQVVVWTS